MRKFSAGMFLVVLFLLSASLEPGTEVEEKGERFRDSRITVETKSQWLMLGLFEELRCLGVKMPRRLDEIQEEMCYNLNVPVFFKAGTYNRLLQESIDIIGKLKVPGGQTRVYADPAFKQSLEWFPGQEIADPQLPVWQTVQILKDKILAVGLKSYPYLADYNGDGLDDMWVGDHDGFLHVYINCGAKRQPRYDGALRLKSLSTGRDIAIRLNPKINIADMNGDGFADLILGNYDGKPYMLPNQSENGYVFDDKKYAYFYEVDGDEKKILDAGNYSYPTVVDYNGDGLYDLVVGELQGDIILFINAGTSREPLFKKHGPIASISPVMYPDPQLIDLNRNGMPDLLVGNREGTIYFFPNVGTAQSPKFSGYSFLTAEGNKIDVGRLSHVHAADWNNDGVLDLITGNDDGEVRVFPGKKTQEGCVPDFGSEILLRTVNPSHLICKAHPVFCVTDWDVDGVKDILAGGEGAEVRFYRNTGTNEKPMFKDYKILPGIRMEKDAFASAGEEEKIYWGNAGLEFITEYLGNVSPEAFDWNGDGRTDLLVGSYTGLVYFYRNMGSQPGGIPSLGEPVALRSRGRLLRVAGFSTPRVVDYDGNGLPDLLVGDLMGRIHVFYNAGTREHPVLDEGRILQVGGEDFMLGPRTIPECADLNGDGLKDILFGNRMGGVYALLNTGSRDNPAFDRIEPLRDKSAIWEDLYGGSWVGPYPGGLTRWKQDRKIYNMNVVATSCPRMVRWYGDADEELLISSRFGLIFRFHKTDD